jgi:PAS domain S-box-containing protein
MTVGSPGETDELRALRSRVAELEALLRTVPMGLAIARDPQATTIRANPYLAEILGVSLDVNISLSAPAAELPPFRLRRYGREVPPEELPLQQVAASGIPLEGVDLEVIRPDGQIRHIRGNVVPLLDEQGVSSGCAGAFWDVTDAVRAEAARQQAEERLRASEGRHEALMEHSYDAIVIVDAGGAVTYASPSTLRIFGYSPGELVGRSAFDVIHPEDVPDAQVKLGEVLREPGTRVRTELRIQHKDGSTVWIEVAGHNLLHEPRVRGVLSSFRDITDRRRAELALRESEARLLFALEAGRLGSWELDMVTDTARRSLRHDQIFGYDPPLPEWGYDTFMDHVLPEDRARIDEGFRAAVDNRTDWHFQCRIRRADGEVRWIEARGSPYRGDKGEVRHMLGVVADITERKLAEEDLRAADQRKDEFLAMLSHELRNPLAAVGNAVELLRLDPGDASVQQEALGVLDRQVGALARLVDDLLDVSRVTTGRVQLQRADVELNALVRGVVDSFRPLMDERRQEFSVSLAGADLWAHADSIRLEQVVVNLLSNAARYTPEGGRISLTVVRQARDGLPHQDDAVIRVQDEGIGIEPDLLPDVFDLFSQGERSIDRAQSGLGIGLALVKSLV